LFEITDKGEQVPCAISRMALEDIGERSLRKTADLLGCFTRARRRIEGLALEKLRARPEGVMGRLSLWADDLGDLPTGGFSMATYRGAALRSGV
jgi:uncharacterized protein DUF1488